MHKKSAIYIIFVKNAEKFTKKQKKSISVGRHIAVNAE
jgi:hypothetical protein